MITIKYKTKGPRFYPLSTVITENTNLSRSGVIYLFCPHTSCGLLLSEGYDPSARTDLEAYFDHIAPENLPFIKHTLEGPDDSPSHMKTALIQSSLSIFYENGSILLGQWQEIYLAEFRKDPHEREIWVKVLQDQS